MNDNLRSSVPENSSAYVSDEQRAALIKSLTPLLGFWKGEGVAQFPTITTCPYLEELRFDHNGEEPVIHFEQKSWIKATGAALHWESGFIRPTENGKLDLLNAQNNGRVEVLRGKLISEKSGVDVFALSFQSVLFGNDARMIRSSRIFHCEKNTLRYIVEMATLKTPRFQQHLTATLRRVA